MHEILRKVSKFNPSIDVSCTFDGDFIVSGTNVSQLNHCSKYLEQEYQLIKFSKNTNERLIFSSPFVSYRETIIGKTGDIDDDHHGKKYPNFCLSKSPNKCSRLYVSAEPMSDELIDEIENGKIKIDNNDNSYIINNINTSQTLVKKYDWDSQDAKKIWSFGCPPGIANCIINCTKGVQYLNDIRNHIVGSFFQVITSGVLMYEPLRGVKFNLVDSILHPDPIRRGAGQIMPTAKRVFYAAQIASLPRIMEPIYLTEFIVYNKENVDKLYNILNQNQKCTVLKSDESKDKIMRKRKSVDIAIKNIRAYIPVAEMIKIDKLLQEIATIQCQFSHWQLIDGMCLHFIIYCVVCIF